MVDLIDNAGIEMKLKRHYIEGCKGIPKLSSMDSDVKSDMCLRDTRFSNNVCICEKVSEGEIMAAMKRPLGAVDLLGIKRRVRAGGMGLCQGRRCKEKVLQIIKHERNGKNKDT